MYTVVVLESERQTRLEQNECEYHARVSKIQVAYHDCIMDLEATNREEIDEYAESHLDESPSEIIERFSEKLAITIQELRTECRQLIEREKEVRDAKKEQILHAN